MTRGVEYSPELCDKIESLGAEGLTLTACAAEIGVHRDTLYSWEKRYPDFAEAMQMARQRAQLFWERTNIKVATSGVGNPSSAIFALKNIGRHDFREHPGLFIPGMDEAPSEGAALPEQTVAHRIAFLLIASAPVPGHTNGHANGGGPLIEHKPRLKPGRKKR